VALEVLPEDGKKWGVELGTAMPMVARWSTVSRERRKG
jgi:hypothetical protein